MTPGRFRLGIDASNITRGGGITHLAELLKALASSERNISVRLWASDDTFRKLPEFDWLIKDHQDELNSNLFFRLYWQKVKLTRLARKHCDLLFVPGSLYVGGYRPFVTMSQNMLPFEHGERKRYGMSLMLLRLILLEWAQSRTFRKADGVIFLSEYAKSSITRRLSLSNMQATIPHGISRDFISSRDNTRLKNAIKDRLPINLLYVSIVDVYKHQWNLIHAVRLLRDRGKDIKLTLVGPAYGGALKRLHRSMDKHDPDRRFVDYRGEVPHTQLPDIYRDADVFVYASSCENLPIILLEAIASGKPVICSGRGPMTEVMEDRCIYFDPEDPQDIARSLISFLELKDLDSYTNRQAELIQRYDWSVTADKTLQFIDDVYSRYVRHHSVV